MQDRAPPSGSFTTVAATAARGQRLDRFLADAIGTLSRSRVKALIEQGLARSDGRVLSEPAEPVRPGATYVLDLPPPAPATPQPQAIPFTILYEDADLIVLDKPAGLVVHPAPGNQDGTLVNALLAHCGEQFTGIGDERRPGIVHRLDKDTSGIMVVAKTQLANTALTAAFAARDLDRAYLALVWGLPNPLAGDIEGADRPRPARAQAHGRRRPKRQTRAHPLPHAARLGHRGRPAGMPARHRADPSDPRAPRQPRQSGGRRSALPAPRAGPRPACCPTRSATGCWTSPARRCTRPGSASPTPAPASHSASPPTRRPTWPP